MGLTNYVLRIDSNLPAPADFFVKTAANGGSDSNNGLTAETPKETITAGMALFTDNQGDQVLEIGDGAYDATGDIITVADINAMKGVSGHPNIIRSETPGGAIIGAELGEVDNTNTTVVYIEWWDFKWRGDVRHGLPGYRQRFVNCCWEGGPRNGNTVVFAGSQWQLYENCWWYGPGGRKSFVLFNAKNTIVRNGLARWDGGWGLSSTQKTDPTACFNLYENDGTVNYNLGMFNLIILDSIDTDSPENGEYSGAFVIGGHADPADVTNVWMEGIMVFDNEKVGIRINSDRDMGLHNFDNSFMVNNGAGYVEQMQTPGSMEVATEFNQCLIYGSNGVVDNGATHFSYAGSLVPTNFTNTIIAQNGGDAFNNGSDNFTGNYNNAFGNGGANLAGTNLRTYDPEHVDNGLLYPCRIESGKTLETDGDGNVRIGPEILYQIGRDGAFYGDPGWNTLQDGTGGEAEIRLWDYKGTGDWPNGARLKADLESVLPEVYVALDSETETYAAFITSDIGKQLKIVGGADIGEIVDYDNDGGAQTVAIKAPHGSATTYIADGTSVETNGGTGKGTANGVSLIHTPDGERGFTGTALVGGPKTVKTRVWELLANATPSDIY